MKIRIQPYKTWSGGAKELGIRAGILRATKKQVQKHGDFDLIINWGSSERKFKGEYVNPPEAVALASDKLAAAKRFTECDVPQPDWTESREEAQRWLDEGDVVVGRHLLRANSGRGITLYRSADGADAPRGTTENGETRGGRRAADPSLYSATLKNAPLYTKYFKKQDEYRVHVMGGRVIDIQQKKKRQEVPNDMVDYQVRNAAAGWVFCREGVECPASVQAAAIQAVDALHLDFGAADIGYNRNEDTPVVFEVNTAPGIEGTTGDTYFNALRRAFPELNGGAYRRRRVQNVHGI